jgi:ADP-heptose:LPS heptosyltransferase
VASIGWGDELMVTGVVRELQRTDPRKVRIAYERGLRWYDAWDNNPRVARLEEKGDFNWFMPRKHGMRPYCAEKTKEKWTWKAYRPPVGELYFTDAERALAAQYAPRVVIDIDIKAGASPNKQWGRHNWEQLAKLLRAADVHVYQMGPLPPTMVPHATFAKTETVRQAAALIANSRAVICHEGALHHIAAAVGTPAVVIYGGYISPEVTGYDGQEALFAGDGLGCGMRVACQHCRDAMDSIKPEAVVAALKRVLNGV